MEEFLKRLALLPPDKRERLLAQLPPLSYAQQRLWFLDQLEGPSPAYNMPAAVRLDGPLRPRALARAFAEVLRRHEPLRTAFASLAGRPLQLLAPLSPPPLPLLDLSALRPPARAEEFSRLRAEEARLPFDLTRPPLLRLRLLRLSPDRHVALVTMHHIASDGWSVGVLVKEVAALYEAYAGGGESPLAELPVRYADYAAWQREHLRGERLARELAYWRGQLADAPALELPTDRPRPAAASYRGGHVAFRLSAEVTRGLREAGRREGATLFMVTLAGFQTLLSRYTGQREVAVGTPVAGRGRRELEGLIGFFVNTVVLRGDLSGDPSFAELVGRARALTLEGYAHAEAPFEQVVEELAPERDLSRSPLFQVMMAFQNTPAEPLRLKGLTLTALPADHFAARFDLLLSLTEADEGITGSLQYRQDLFDATTAERMVEHYQTLMAGAAADPRRPISRLPLLSERERKQQLEEWNATAAEYPRHRCVHELFEEQAERTPDAVAVADGHDEVTYRELNRRANQLAHHLRGMGVRAGQSVGVCVGRSVETALAALAVLKAGGAYVPLEVESGPERLRWVVEDAGLCLLVTRQRVTASPPVHVEKTVSLDTDWEQVAQAPAYNPAVETDEEQAACVVYKSTAAGKPLGVVLSHRHLLERLFRAQDTHRLGTSDSLPPRAPSGSDPAAWEIFRPLLSGDRLVMARSGGAASQGEEGAGGTETLVEELVAVVWGELLGREVWGRGANFFEVGGDAQSGARIMSRVREVFGVDLEPRWLFERPTLGGLSAVIEERMIEEAERTNGGVLT